MTALTDHVLFNATVATLLAPIAYASRWLGRPMLTHALWLIVLARLIVPPVWFFTVPTWTAEPPLAESLPVMIDDAAPIFDEIAIAPNEPLAWVEPETPAMVPAIPSEFPWPTVLLASLAMVAVAWWGRLVFHALRFQRLLQYASPADFGTRKLVEKLARHMGLRRAPQVVMIPARLSPCVWCFSARPVLLLPQDWTGRQHRLNRAAVLVHELAHLRRGDHWVRWFELVVTGLFWWLPTVWFARKHLREAEELCCDGWVIATLPAARHAYASALIDMADYLAPLRPALPPLASGFGQVHELRRRLHMILHAKPTVKAGRSGAAIALGLGLFLLPVGLVRSQEREQEQQPPTPEQRDRAAVERARAADEREQAEKERARAAEARNRAEVSRRDAVQAELKAELAEAQKRLADAQKAVERIRQRMNEAGIETRNDPVAAGGGGRAVSTPRSPNPFGGEGGRGGGSGGGVGAGRGGAPGAPSRSSTPDVPPEPPQAPRSPQPVEAPRGVAGRPLTTRSNSDAIQALEKAMQDLQQQRKSFLDKFGNEHPSVKEVDNQIATLEEAMRRVRSIRSSSGGGAPPGATGPGGMRTTPAPTSTPNPRAADDRVQQLERQLEVLRKELESMRRDLRRDPGERATTERRSDNRPPDRSPQP